jgi:hypothetical protein
MTMLFGLTPRYLWKVSFNLTPPNTKTHYLY